ncbi:VTC domain-containing protein [Candidatus Pelagibacter sp.]|nr:VTC domain-containing protein [Candidatus Pelagibacter sp.]
MNDQRIEKKFVLGKNEDDSLKKILLINGFTKIFSSREIDSIYLDTENYDFAKDNINGVSKRKKLRFRWYNNDLTNVYFEEKKKQNFLVEKKVNKISISLKKINLVHNLKEYLENLNKDYNDFNYRFVLRTNYLRSYWISDNKKIRATIDSNINVSPIFDLSRKLCLNETILELKFSPSNENSFRNFFYNRNLNLRSKKFSKYIQSFHLLEDSGLIF